MRTGGMYGRLHHREPDWCNGSLSWGQASNCCSLSVNFFFGRGLLILYACANPSRKFNMYPDSPELVYLQGLNDQQRSVFLSQYNSRKKDGTTGILLSLF